MRKSKAKTGSMVDVMTKEQEDAHDDVLAALSTIASPAKSPVRTANSIIEDQQNPKSKPRKRVTVGMAGPAVNKRRGDVPKFIFATDETPCPFLYYPSTSFEASVHAHKKSIRRRKKEAPEILDKEVESRKTQYKEQLPSLLRERIDEVREFFLSDIAPLLLAVNAGTTQAKAVIERTLETPIQQPAFSQFERMVQSGANIKMARFVSRCLRLPKGSAEALLNGQGQKPREVLIPMPMPMDDRRLPQRTNQQSRSRTEEPRDE